MTVSVRAAFPSGTTTATLGGGSLNTTTSVTLVAGDALEVHQVFNGPVDTGITMSCKLDPAGANLSPDGQSTAVHSNGQSAGFEQVFYYTNPTATLAAGTYNVTVTFSGTSGGSEMKVYALSGTDHNAPAITTFAPTGTGTTTAASITSPTIPSGGLGLSHFCAGSAFTATGQTQQCIAQNSSATDAANAIAGASVAGTGATVNMTATIGSGGDWYAAIATAWAPAGAGTNYAVSGTAAATSAVSGAVTAKLLVAGTVAAISAVAGALVPNGASGTVAAVSATSGTITANHTMSGTIAGTSGVTGGITANHPVTGTVAASSVTSGALTPTGRAWFTDSGVGGTGAPLLLVNDESWSVIANGGVNHSGDFHATYVDFFTTRQAQGYKSTLQSWCAFGTSFGTAGGRGATGADSDGTTPFSTAMDPTTTPNSTFWNRRDDFIAVAAAHNMYVLLSATTPYLHQGSPNTAPQVSWSTAQWTAFGTFLGTRYASANNVMWMVGDDYFNDINSNLIAFKNALRAAGAQQPIAVQYYVETSSAFDEWTGSPGVPGSATALASQFADWNHGYSYNVSYDIVEKQAAWNDAHTPVPYLWGDGYFLQNASSPLTDVQLMRHLIWWALAASSKGFTVGDDNVWPWYDPATIPPNGSLGEIQGTGSNGLFYNNVVPAISTYFSGLRNWHLLKPDLTSSFVTAGRGTHITASISGGFYGTGGTGDSDNYVAASITPAGDLAVCYLPKATTITVDTSKLAAGWTAKWVDPKTCATSSAGAGPTFNSTAKGSNSDGKADWVLVFAAPVPSSGTVAATSTTAGSITANRAATATTTATTTTAGTVTANHALSGTAAATSATSGDMSVTGGATSWPLAGAVTATSTTTGTVTARHTLAGAATAVTTTYGAPTITGEDGLDPYPQHIRHIPATNTTRIVDARGHVYIVRPRRQV